jgi:hypothetical protein
VFWTPRNDAELTAGWRLWLELSTQPWPDATWTESPADAVWRLRELFAVCNEIETEYHDAESTSGEVVRLLRSMVFAASAPVELWWDDAYPLDEERAARLHADLGCFADHADGVREILAAGGGWSSLNLAMRQRPAA